MAVAAMIGIGHRLPCPPGDMIEEKGKLGLRPFRPQPSKVAKIGEVEGDHMIEAIEIRRLDLPCPKMIDVNAVAPGRGPRARIRRLADVPVAGPGAVHFNVYTKTIGFRPKRRLGERGPADIAQADEQDSDGHRRSLVAKAVGSASHWPGKAQREG